MCSLSDNKSALFQVMAWYKIGNKPWYKANDGGVHNLINASWDQDVLINCDLMMPYGIIDLDQHYFM